MPDCHFTIPFSQSAEQIINHAKTAIEKNNGSFEGDSANGRFAVSVLGTISGSYSVSGQEMHITVSSKPVFISCKQIESFMRKNITGEDS